MADSNTGTRIAPPDAVPDDGDPASRRRAKTRPTVIADNGQKCQRKRDAARKDRLTASAALSVVDWRRSDAVIYRGQGHSHRSGLVDQTWTSTAYRGCMPALPGLRSPVLLELDLVEPPAVPIRGDMLSRLRSRGRPQLRPTLRALHEAAADRHV